MPNPEAVAYLQDHLDKLPDPDNQGQRMMFVDFTRFPGQHEEQQKLIEANCKRIAGGVVLAFDEGEFAIVRKSEVARPPMLGSHPLIRVQCSACGGSLLQLTPNNEGIVSVASSTVTGLEHRCPL